MNSLNSPLNHDTFISSSGNHSDAILHELILREYFLMCAIAKTFHRNPKLSTISDEALLTDLESNEEFLSTLSEDVLVPAIDALTSPAARQWELDLLTLLSRSDSRWESVRRLIEELRAVTKLIDILCEKLPECAPHLFGHRLKLGAHLDYQERILTTWIKTELSFGRPVEKVLEKESRLVAAQWQNVVSEMLGAESSESSDDSTQSWRCLPHAVKLMAQSLLSLGRGTRNAA